MPAHVFYLWTHGGSSENFSFCYVSQQKYSLHIFLYIQKYLVIYIYLWLVLTDWLVVFMAYQPF